MVSAGALLRAGAGHGEWVEHARYPRYAPVISAVFLARFAIAGNRVIIEEFERSGYNLLHRLTIPFPHDLCWDRPL